MCAYQLAEQGKRVIILEARDRIGGRIWQLNDFGFPVQAGAEFVHGDAPVTRALAKAAGLTIIPIDNEMMEVVNGKFVVNDGIAPYQTVLAEKLNQLKEDIPVAAFLSEYFGGVQYQSLRQYVITTVEGYDAADPQRISTFSLRDEWLGGKEWKLGKIKEGYGTFITFLESQCQKLGVAIYVHQEVTNVDVGQDAVTIGCANGKRYAAQNVVLTTSLPILQEIVFKPGLSEKRKAASQIGFGGVIKIQLLFDDDWWRTPWRHSQQKMAFLFSKEVITTWWGQYPESLPLLTGWVAGPKADQIKKLTTDEMIDRAITSLSNIFGMSPNNIKQKLRTANVANWLTDKFARGAYSYPTPESERALRELAKPVNNRIFFAGEAFYRGQETATVEGALTSGQQTAIDILNL